MEGRSSLQLTTMRPIYPPTLSEGGLIDRNAKFLLPLQCKKAPDPKIEGLRLRLALG